MKDSNKPLIAAMIIIGIIIIILLLTPRMRVSRGYSFNQASLFTASAVPIVDYKVIQSPQVIKTYGHPITVNTGYSYSSHPVTKTTTYEYIYPSSQQYYAEGCTEYTAYSATTGYPCR